MKRVRFEPTPPLPSYLLAFGVGAFDFRDAGSTVRSGVPMRVVTPRGRAGEASYAAGITGRIVDRLEAYFDRPYPYAKLDSLAVPVTVTFGAMEHPGLITYAARLLLARPAEQTPHFERGYVSTAAHELAHQWFGNLVTLDWWDDLWLNESLASWMGDRITAEVMPGWGWETSTQQARAQAMQADRLVSARRIQQPVQRDEDMGNLWDAITYAKGQTVLAMFEGWLGPERFQAGVRRYINRHAGGNAASADFFAALAVDDPGLPVALRSFTTQPGIPRIGVALQCEGAAPRLQITQSRLLPLGSPGASSPAPRWQVPLRLRTPAGDSRLLLTAPEATLTLPDSQCPAWVQANVDGVGYYRVAYGGDLMARLAAAPDLRVGEILALVDDAGGLHGAGDIVNAQLLALVQAFAGHPRREVALAAADLLQHLQPLVEPAQRTAYAGRWQAAFGDRARTLGWLPQPDDSDDERLLRIRLLPLVADLGEDTALRSQALQLAQAWLADHAALDAGMRKPVLATAALAGDDALFGALLAALRTSPHRHERTDLLAALASFRQPALTQRALALLLDAGIDIRESQRPLLRAMAGEPAQRRAALAFVAQHHGELVARLGRDEPAWLPSAFEAGCSADEGRLIAQAFDRHAARFQGGRLNLTRTLEAVRLCTAWRAAQTGGL
jgi:alanyl aminopeptidase